MVFWDGLLFHIGLVLDFEQKVAFAFAFVCIPFPGKMGPAVVDKSQSIESVGSYAYF